MISKNDGEMIKECSVRIDVSKNVSMSCYGEETNGLIDVKVTCLFWSH
jgi:hypothetical protein